MHKYNLQQLLILFPNMNFEWINSIQNILQRLNNLNWYFVGGCVRDSLINKKTYDIDITTTAQPDEIEQRMNGLTIATIGREFGTIGVYVGNWKIEITTTRHDIKTFGRFAEVNFVNNFYEDSIRRDFTMNALLFNGVTLIDYHNGIFDLINKQIIFIGQSTSTGEQIGFDISNNINIINNSSHLQDAQKRIEEDFLRIIRYIRFYFRFNSDLNNFLYADIFQKSLYGLVNVSKERFLNEIDSICKNSNRVIAIQTLNELKLSETMFGLCLNTENLNEIYELYPQWINVILFRYGCKNTLKSLPLSRETQKMIAWINNPKYTCNVIQLAHIYNISKDIKCLLFMAYILRQDIYTKLLNQNIEFKRVNLMVYEEKIRGMINDICISIQLI